MGGGHCICHGTNKRCGERQICSQDGTCVCTNGGTPPDCDSICSTCSEHEVCNKDPYSGREFCQCKFGGNPGKCHPKCTKNCPDTYECVRNQKGDEACLCKETHDKKK